MCRLARPGFGRGFHDDDHFDDLHEAEPTPKAAPRARIAAQADEHDEEAFAGLMDEESAHPAAVVKSDEPQSTAVLAVQLGSQEQLRRLPRTRLTELLERYRDCLEQAASLYDGETFTFNDGSTLVLFHSGDSGEDYLTNAICCGELLRAWATPCKSRWQTVALPCSCSLA